MAPGRAIAWVLLATLASCNGEIRDRDWYKHGIVYQIYPRSFKDSNGDGIGDLNGITSKLEHIADIGATALWLSPIYTSPQLDFGYDIANFTDVDPDYGTLADFDRLVAKAKSLGLKVILDFVPNHSSHQHPWFLKSVQRIKPYDEYYVWRDARIVNGTRHPPNNWLSAFQGSAWEWNEERKQYYYHMFVAGQPDLNYRNKDLDQEMKNVFTFWLDRGVDGFRIDALNTLFEDPRLLDEPPSNVTNVPSTDPNSLDHIYTLNQPEIYDVLGSWRRLMDEHANQHNSDAKLVLTEAYTTEDHIRRYYQAGSNAPFNFMFITELNNRSDALDFKVAIDKWLNNMPDGDYVANWVVGNHDQHRAASRFGRHLVDHLNMLAIALPGITVVYNGDEIGMEDRFFSYSETVDPAGCNAGPERYQETSRDPERTPYQWDATTSAGFSSNNNTWLPVHPNYQSLNLAEEKKTWSHYQVFKALSTLKRNSTIQESSFEIRLATEKVLAVVRRDRSSKLVGALLLSFHDSPVEVDVKGWLNLPDKLVVLVPGVNAVKMMAPGAILDASKVTLPAYAAVTVVGNF